MVIGVVRNGVFGTAVPGVRLDVPELHAAACSDSAGAYALSGLPTGAVTLRATRAGYDTLSVTLTLPVHGVLRVDLALAPKLVVLDSVRVNAPRPISVNAPSASNTTDNDGTWSWHGNPSASDASTGEPDLMRTLSDDAHFALRPDWPGSLTDRGGTSDQLAVRVDGLEVWSPTHGGGTFSAISPDAIADLDVRDGAMSAAFGDRLGGVLDVTTRDVPTTGWTGSASIGPSAVRATWGEPLSIGDASGGVFVAARHSNDDLPQLANDAGPIPDRWADGIVTGAMTAGRATFKAVVVASDDRAAPLGGSLATDALSPTAVPWSTATAGLIWTQKLSSETQLESHVSTARFDATVPTAGDSLGPSLGDGIRQTELATQLTWHTMTAGASYDALNVSYRVEGDPAAAAAAGSGLGLGNLDPTSRQPLTLMSAPTTTSAFVEQRWGPAGADSLWHITTGLRGTALLGTTARLEPRVDGALRVLPGVVATIGYARTHQIVQSLRNAESPVGAELGLDLPAAAGPGGVPVAQSDIGTAGIIARLGAIGRLSIDGYLRALSGLAIASPFQAALFAASAFERASAHISGAATQIDGGTGRFTWQAGYGVGHTIESVSGVSYHPTSELGQTGSMAAGIALDRLTQVRFAGWAAYGQPAPGLDVTAVTHEGDAADPQTDLVQHLAPTPLVTTTRLPPYLRADVQLAHQWQTGPATGRLSSYLTLANVFNHANVADELPTGPGGALRGVTLLPRTVLLGLGWAY
jgi:Carboxypeptidase regulatory-like domain/TonB-dependent Receptor Plug Domain